MEHETGYLLYDKDNNLILGTVMAVGHKSHQNIGHSHKICINQIDFTNMAYNPETKRLYEIKLC